MRLTQKEFIETMHISSKQLEQLYSLNENSKEYKTCSKHKDVFMFEVKMKVNKYKEIFYINAIQLGMKTVDLIVYNTYEEALKEIDSIIEDTIQGSLF